MKQIAESGIGPKNQIPSMGCNIKMVLNNVSNSYKKLSTRRWWNANIDGWFIRKFY